MKKIEFYKTRLNRDNGGLIYEPGNGYLKTYAMDGGITLQIVYSKDKFGRWISTELTTGCTAFNCWTHTLKAAMEETEGWLSRQGLSNLRRIELWIAKRQLPSAAILAGERS